VHLAPLMENHPVKWYMPRNLTKHLWWYTPPDLYNCWKLGHKTYLNEKWWK